MVVCFVGTVFLAFQGTHWHCIPVFLVTGMRAQLHLVIVAIAPVCAADDAALPWCFSFMDVMRDLSAKSARVFKLIRWSLSPAGADGERGSGDIQWLQLGDGLVSFFRRR